jgi:hypothetical protein
LGFLTLKTGEKFYVIACHVLWRELCHAGALSRNTLTFQFLKQGLHNTPDLLRQKLQEAIDAVPEDEGYSAILVAYGLCCNGIEGIAARNIRLVFMRGHDCITFLLGSKERYRELAENSPGTYWYSPGWIETGFTPGRENYETMLCSYTEKYGEDNALYLMETEQGWLKKYTTAAYVDTGICNDPRYREYTRECAEFLGLRYEELKGNPKLIEDFLDGRWDTENFLIVEPGRVVVAAQDERVIMEKIGV